MSGELNLGLYDELAAKHNAAYAAFVSMFEARTPRPQPPALPRWNISFVVVALVIMTFASVIVSGTRTVAEFGGDVIGWAAFIMLEGAIIAYAFFRTRLNLDEQRVEGVRKKAERGLALAFAITLLANIHTVLQNAGIELPSLFGLDTQSAVNIIVSLAVAISAPSLAFISGDILALETLRNRQQRKRVEDEYQAALNQWAAALNEQWSREKARWGVSVRVEAERPQFTEPVHSVHSLNSVNERNERTPPLNSANGYTKQMDAKSVIRQFFVNNPDTLNDRLDDLVGRIERETGVRVGRTSIHNVRKEMPNGGNEQQP